MADLLGVETGWVWLRDPASGRFYNAAVQSLPPYLQEPVRMTGRSCWCLELFRSGQLTARNIDVVGCSRLAPAVAVARGRVDRRPALPRERAALCRGSAARRDEPRDARMAAPDATGARSADDDRRSGRRGDRAGAPRRAIHRACPGRRALAHRPRRPRHARAGDSPPSACTSRPACRISSRATGRGRRCAWRSTRPVRASTKRRRSITSLRASPLENRSLAEALGALVAPVHGRHRRARPHWTSPTSARCPPRSNPSCSGSPARR